MATTEKIYIVPLRKGFHETEKYRKTKKAVTTLRLFLKQHLKQQDDKKILIGKNLNEELWKHGIKNPPGKVKIVVIKEDDGTVKAELFGHSYTHKKKEAKEEKKSGVEEKIDAVKKKVAKKTDTPAEKKAKSTGAPLKKEHHDHNHETGPEHENKHSEEHARAHEMPKSSKKAE